MTSLATKEIPCPLCQSEQSREVLSTRDYVYEIEGQFRYVRCLDCQHVYLNPRPDDDVLMDCYPSEYEPHTSEITSGAQAEANTDKNASRKPIARRILGRIPFLKKFLNWLGQQHATVIPELPTTGPNRLLEVGCADGRYLCAARDAGWQVDGIEPAEPAAERARKLGFDVAVTTLSQAELADESREAIAAWMVLEHVPDPVPFVQSAHRILCPSGKFCFSVPNGAGFERSLFGRYWLGYDAPRHLQVFTAARLKALLLESGFHSVQIIHQSSIRYWWGSIAACGVDRRKNAAWPKRWMGYFISGMPHWMNVVSLVPEKNAIAAEAFGSHHSGRDKVCSLMWAISVFRLTWIASLESLSRNQVHRV